MAVGRAPAAAERHGLLAVDKATGVTSHDVVELVRRHLHAPGAGHLGTLDPAASGLLLVAVGAATRCIPVWQGGEKTYEATVRLGVVTASQDLQGEVLEQHPVTVDEAAVRAASPAFVGDLMQVPPMVSALKVGGQRLHRLARRGVTVERAPRPVRVEAWEWLSFELPDASFRVRCSGGTYVRTLAHDLGAALGTGGALAALRRLRSAPFDLSRAVTVAELSTLDPDALWARGGLPLDAALAAVLPSVTLDPDAADEIGYGRRPAVEPAGAPLAAGPRSVVFRDGAGHALALGALEPTPHAPGRALACAHVVFPWARRDGPRAPAEAAGA
jgi:tRNA pseudouridine55 synthase